jgi:hypothetical protein
MAQGRSSSASHRAPIFGAPDFVPSDVDIERLPPPARKALQPEAPAPLRMMAARGVIPGAKPADIVTVVALLTESGDAATADAARTTLGKLPAPMLQGALSGDLAGSVIDKLVRARTLDPELVSTILRLPRLLGETLEHLAETADEQRGEVIATNEVLMLQNPSVIEKLYMNKAVRMSTADRLIELAVRNGLELGIAAFKEAAAAIQNELIAEPSEEPSFDDLLFKEADELAKQLEAAEVEDTHEVDEEGEEQVREKFLPLHAKISQMTITQKIRTAMLGNAAERLILVRDSNRLVAMAAVKSPNMRDNEAVRISAARSVGEDVLRVIAMNREFTRHYQVKLNLVQNPRTPFTFASRLISHLRDNDLKVIGKSKNVSGAVSQAVRQQLSRKG